VVTIGAVDYGNGDQAWRRGAQRRGAEHLPSRGQRAGQELPIGDEGKAAAAALAVPTRSSAATAMLCGAGRAP